MWKHQKQILAQQREDARRSDQAIRENSRRIERLLKENTPHDVSKIIESGNTEEINAIMDKIKASAISQGDLKEVLIPIIESALRDARAPKMTGSSRNGDRDSVWIMCV